MKAPFSVSISQFKDFLIFQSSLIYGRGQIDESEILVFDDRSFRLLHVRLLHLSINRFRHKSYS